MNSRWIVRAALFVSPMLLFVSLSRGADEGAALYKSKCAGCHGPGGEGKPAMKAPALKGTTWDVDKITQHLTKGEAEAKAPHNKGISGLSEAQAKTIAEFVKTLK